MFQPPFRYSVVGLWILLIGIFLNGCGSSSNRSLPLDSIKQTQKNIPTYAILLENMKEEGNFIKTYFHKYRIIEPENAWTTDWLQVPKSFYRKNENFMGMTLFAKKNGEIQSTVQPPGYAYVGDSRYGHWRRDAQGNSFWEFYGKYALLSQFFGGWYRPIYRNDYDSYQHYRNTGRTFYGRTNEYGSNGAITRKQKPNFYARRMSTLNKGKKSFSSKVSSRIGRTRNSFRGRAGGKGK